MDRFIDEAECLDITSLSRVTRWRLEGQDKFPKRIRISPNRIAWLASEISDWQNEVSGAQPVGDLPKGYNHGN